MPEYPEGFIPDGGATVSQLPEGFIPDKPEGFIPDEAPPLPTVPVTGLFGIPRTNQPAPSPSPVANIDRTALPDATPEQITLSTRIGAALYNPVLAIASIPHAIENLGAQLLNSPFYAGQALGIVPKQVPVARITPNSISQEMQPVAPPFAAEQPLFHVPYTPTELNPEPPDAVKLGNVAAGMVTPGVAVMTGLGGAMKAPQAIAGYYAPQMAAGVPSEVQQAVEELQQPGVGPREAVPIIAKPLFTSAMAALATHGAGVGKAKPVEPTPIASGDYLTSDAIQDLPSTIQSLREQLLANQVRPSLPKVIPPAGVEPVRAETANGGTAGPVQTPPDNTAATPMQPAGAQGGVTATPPPPFVPDEPVAPAAAPVQSGVAPVAPGQEPSVKFLHDLRGVASMISGNEGLGRLSKEQASAFNNEGNQIFLSLTQDNDLSLANKALVGLRERVSNAVATTEKARATGQQEKSLAAGKQESTVPPAADSSRPEPAVGLSEEEQAAEQQRLQDALMLPPGEPIALQGPRLMDRPEELGFKNVDASYRPDATQLYNRLRNMATQGGISQGEMDVYDKAGLKDFLATKPTMGEVKAWMENKGPKWEVKVLKSGQGKDAGTKAGQRVGEIQHQIETQFGGTPSVGQDSYSIAGPDGRVTRFSEYDPAINDYKKVETLQAEQVPDENLRRLLLEYRENYRIWDQSSSSRESFDPDTYRSIAPKDADQTVVMVRVPVDPNLSPKERGPLGDKTKEGASLHSGHHFGPEDRNVLGWARVQYEDTPQGKVAHVIEAQSDWGQRVRELKQSVKDEWAMQGERGPNTRKQIVDIDHPLLRDYNRLVLKAAIAQALRDGAKHIVLSDAETAMMTEGHDLQSKLVYGDFKSKDAAEKSIVGTKHYDEAATSWFVKENKDKGTWEVWSKIPQEPGMRLNYDKILPQIMEELTGEKGEKVELGEHQRAMEKGNGFVVRRRDRQAEASYATRQEAEDYIKRSGKVNLEVSDERFRKNLIFRNPDGTPKTTATGLSYDLSRVIEKKEPFSLMGKDKMPGEKKSVGAPSFEDQAREATVSNQQAIRELGLDKPDTTAHSALTAMVDQPESFGKTYSGLAKFLLDHFEVPLRDTPILAGDMTRYISDVMNPRIEINAMDNTWSLPFKVLHEAAHAATYWQFEHPMTPEHYRAVREIKALREAAIAKLPFKERQFFYKEYQPAVERSVETSIPVDLREKFDAAGIPRDRETLMYALASDHEFIGGMFTNQRFRALLNAMDVEGQPRSIFQRLLDSIRELLGIRKGSGLERAFESLQEAAGSDKRAIGGDMERSISAPPGPPTAALVRDMSRDEFLRHKAAYLSGWSAPRHVAISENLGNRLVSYASSRIAAPLEARSLATQVLGKGYKDANFDKLLGAAIVEDQLRGVRKAFFDAAAKEPDPIEKAKLNAKGNSVTTLIGQPYSPFKNEKLYQTWLANADNKAAIERHKALIQPIAEQAHVELGGKLASPGEQTGAFANLVAILSPDDIESARGMLYSGGRRGDITNQLKKGSAFSKERKGTAWMYETSYREIAERMIRGNWEQKRLRDLISAYEQAGVAKEQKPGEPMPTSIKGEKLIPQQVELRGGGPGMTRSVKLWMRPDLVEEFKQAVQTDTPVRKAGLGLILDAINDAQIFGVTDAAWHTANMISAIGSSQGGRNLLLDLGRKFPGVQLADAIGRVVKAGVDVYKDSPEVQEELAQVAKVGAGRSPAVHSSLIGKGVKAVTGTEKLDPSYWTARAISFLDKSGRVALNRMYDNLVDRGLAADSDLGRREFINKMGQYNRRLMSKVQDLAREYNISSFVVAGRNFNRLAMQKIMMSPGIKAANPMAATKMRATEAAGAIMALLAAPVVIQYAAHKFLGAPSKARPNVPWGSIDTGKDDEQGRPITIDLLQTMLFRRGLRVTGLQALDKGLREDMGTKTTTEEMAKDIISGALHPWEGPVPRFAYGALSGRELPPQNYLISRNPYDMGENVKAALSQLNPSYAAVMGTQEEGKVGGLKGLGEQLGGALGYKKGRYPTMQEKYDAEAAKLGRAPDLGDRVAITQKLQSEKEPNMNVLTSRRASEQQLWKDFGRQDRLVSALPQDQQQWLQDNKLKISGFQSEINLGHVQVPMKRDEAEKMEKVFAAWYGKGIEQLMNDKGFANMPATQRQEVLNKTLDEMRKAARQVWLATVAQQR